MDEGTRKVLGELISPPDLVEQFINLLKEKGVSIDKHEYDKRTKYFLASKGENRVFVLAHESNKDGWWGIGSDLVRRAMNVGAQPKHKLSGVGAALLDQKPSRGFWVSGEAIIELNEIGLVNLTSQGSYHFNRHVLEDQVELAPSFSSIEKFFRLAGLE